MIKVIVPAAAALAVNVTAGLLLSAYPLMNMLFTSLAIAVNTLLVALLFCFRAESTQRMSLGMIFLGVGIIEYASGLLAPARWTDNWWVILFAVLTAIQAVLVYLTLYYTKNS